MGAEFEAKLEGADAVLGRVAAGDVGRLLIGLERAIQIAAAVAVKRRPKVTGRRVKPAEDASRLKLRAITRGSVTSVLELPDIPLDEDTLDLELQHLGEQALDNIMDMLETRRSADPAVVHALEQLVDEVGIGRRYDRVRIRRLDGPDSPPREGIISDETVSSLRAAVAETIEVRDDTLVGELVEADFEKRTARLKTQAGADVVVSFGEDLAHDIHWALPPGHDPMPIQFEGRVTYDPHVGVARSVTLHRIASDEQLMVGLDIEDFWARPTIEEIARDQGIPPELARIDPDPAFSDDEAAEFLAALGDI